MTDPDDAADDELEDAAAPDASVDFAALGPWWSAPPGVDLGLTAHLGPDGAPRVIERRFTVTEDLAGQRLDHYLKRMIPRLSRTRLQTVIRTQLSREARDDGAADTRPFRASSTVATGDRWLIRRAARAEPPCPRTFGVLHKDDEVLVVDKPAGLPVHASAKFYFNTLTRVVDERFPGEDWQICHRLDRETSGALVLARTPSSAARLKGCFADKRAAKTYLAIVHGDPPWPDAGVGEETLDFPLHLAQPGDPSRLPHVRMLIRDTGLPSTTLVSVVRRVPGFALVRCRLITGRQHQIRAHVAHAGFPIAGDKLYGAGEDAFIAFCDRGWTRALAETLLLPRHALHAARIVVPHPTQGTPLDAEAPLPWDLDAFLASRR